MWSYEVWQLYILIIGTVWIGCRMTLFSVALYQHSFNLFISVAFQDKPSYSQESAVVPISQMRSGSTESRKDLGPNPQLQRFNHSPFVPGAPAQSLPSLEVQSRRDLFYSPDLKPNLLLFPASNFYLHEMSNRFCLVASAAPGTRGVVFWVPCPCKGAPKMGVRVTLWVQVATCIQLRWQNEKGALNDRTEWVHHISKFTITNTGFVLCSYGLFIELFLTSISLTEKKMKLCGMMRVMKDGEGSCLLACFP